MKYGYFDDARREYVIDRPDTPMPWSNYLGDRRYGSILSNNGIGYSFTRSPAQGRILRYSYTAPMTQQPWRGFYLRDARSGDYWSNFWQPVAKPLESFHARCRMGTGYVVSETDYACTHTATTYFVPLDQSFEYWHMAITNSDYCQREIDVFSFAEFTTEWHIMHDVYNRQYSDYIAETDLSADGLINHRISARLKIDENFANRDQSRWAFLGLCGDVECVSHDCDRDVFLGAYGSYAAPQAVARGSCSGSTSNGGHPCGVVQGRVIVPPGGTRHVIVIIGAGQAAREGRAVMAEFGSVQRAEAEMQRLKDHWAGLLGRFKCKTSDPAVDSMLNVWNAYNALMTFEWSRSCSLVYSGMDRDGFGFRDTVQDLVASTSLIPERSRERLLLMLSGQEAAGGAQPVVDPVHFKPGHMKPTHIEDQRADDCLWFFNAVQTYLSETGELSLLDEVVPFADAGEGTILEHLRRALQFGLDHRGKHGFVCGLSADWNDCIRLGTEGESLFVTFQLRYGLERFIAFAEIAGDPAGAAWAREQLTIVDRAIQTHGWDGEWFLRAIAADGMVFGGKDCDEGRIFLNPQTWSVISGAAAPDQARVAMNSVEKWLAGDYGLQLCEPAYEKIDCSIMRAVLFNPGVKENGGIFSHTQPWAVMAECMLGNGDRAFRYLKSYLPAAQNDRAEIRQIELYVHCQSTFGRQNPHSGRSRVPWLSGSVAWSYHVMSQWILGIRPELDGLRIDPCIPHKWPGFSVERVYRGKRIRIRVENPDRLCRGVRTLEIVGGQTVEGNLLAPDLIVDGMEVVARIA